MQRRKIQRRRNSRRPSSLVHSLAKPMLSIPCDHPSLKRDGTGSTSSNVAYKEGLGQEDRKPVPGEVGAGMSLESRKGSSVAKPRYNKDKHRVGLVSPARTSFLEVTSPSTGHIRYCSQELRTPRHFHNWQVKTPLHFSPTGWKR